MSLFLSSLFVMFGSLLSARAEDASVRYHCEGRNQDRAPVDFDFIEDGFVEGVGYGSEVISITRIAKRTVAPPYRFQRVGANEDNLCELDSFGDHYLLNFTQMPNHEGNTKRYPYKVTFKVECADMPLLNVTATCERTRDDY